MTSSNPLKRSDFSFELPQERIAQQPLEDRSASRMMVLRRATQSIEHHVFRELPDLLTGDETIVYNNSRVIPARMWGKKEGTGGQVEILVTRILDDGLMEAITRSSKGLREGTRVVLDNTGVLVRILAVPQPGKALILFETDRPPLAVLEEEGAPPLPPYIHRPVHWDDTADRARYQTVYAKHDGSVAAPTAGLHFTPEVLARLDQLGIPRNPVTLHVGPGTFMPIRVENVEDHQMEVEHFTISTETADAINDAKNTGKPVLAIGTTSTRCVETAGQSGMLQAGLGSSQMFITPGYEFRIVDRLLTNFHLPESTLIMLVSALAGREFVLEAYRVAVEMKYRFYSYGDCMLIL